MRNPIINPPEEAKEISVNVDLHGLSFYDDESKMYVAYCPASDVSSYCDTQAEAIEGLRETGKIHLDHIKENTPNTKYLIKLRTS